MYKLNESTYKILEYLNTYRFLTPQQLVRLGVASHRNSIYRIIKPLKSSKKPLVQALNVAPQFGRLPAMLYLTKEGANLLAKTKQISLSEINYPKKEVFLSKDYLHRRTIIDFQIEIRLLAERAGHDILFYDTDFDFTGNNRNKKNPMQAKNRVELKEGYIIPDSIFMLQTAKSDLLYVVEIHNGSDSKRALKTLEQNLVALNQGVVSEKYSYDFAHRVLMVFEKQGCLRATLNRFIKNNLVESFQDNLLFRAINGIENNIFNDWIRLDVSNKPFLCKANLF